MFNKIMASYVMELIFYMMFMPLLLCISNDYYNLNENEEQQENVKEKETDGRRSGQNILVGENVTLDKMLDEYTLTTIQSDVEWSVNSPTIYNTSDAKRSKSVELTGDSVEEIHTIEDDRNIYFYDEITILSNKSIDVSSNDSLPKVYNQKMLSGEQSQYECRMLPITPRRSKWYISEQYPCWNLPILYAENGNLFKDNGVFAIHGQRLKRIVSEKNDSIPKIPLRPKPYIKRFSKEWCNDMPCYADHTLCYFDLNQNSKFCKNDFTIQVPGVFEQVAIVNTINSMRNHVANGRSATYSHLPTAANMEQIVYHYDLQKFSKVWLRQCLPGPAMCSSLNGMIVTELECTKYANLCCVGPSNADRQCSPLRECFIPPIIGCLHAWFESAGKKLKKNHIPCGHITHWTYNTVQLLWAKTALIGCATSKQSNGDIRVICNFSPGIPVSLKTKYYCGLKPHIDITKLFNVTNDVTSFSYAKGLGISLTDRIPYDFTNNEKIESAFYSESHDLSDTGAQAIPWGADSLFHIYNPGWARRSRPNNNTNGTLGFVATLVTQYRFFLAENEPIYLPGPPGSQCLETGWLFSALCYEYRDPTPSYRLVAVLAPVALFTLILYDLFSGVVRQTIES